MSKKTRKLLEYIIKCNGNISTAEFDRLGFSFGYWFAIASRPSNQIVKNAKKALKEAA